MLRWLFAPGDANLQLVASHHIAIADMRQMRISIYQRVQLLEAVAQFIRAFKGDDVTTLAIPASNAGDDAGQSDRVTTSAIPASNTGAVADSGFATSCKEERRTSTKAESTLSDTLQERRTSTQAESTLSYTCSSTPSTLSDTRRAGLPSVDGVQLFMKPTRELVSKLLRSISRLSVWRFLFSNSCQRALEQGILSDPYVVIDSKSAITATLLTTLFQPDGEPIKALRNKLFTVSDVLKLPSRRHLSVLSSPAGVAALRSGVVTIQDVCNMRDATQVERMIARGLASASKGAGATQAPRRVAAKRPRPRFEQHTTDHAASPVDRFDLGSQNVRTVEPNTSSDFEITRPDGVSPVNSFGAAIIGDDR
jgi:hypothetical protein